MSSSSLSRVGLPDGADAPPASSSGRKAVLGVAALVAVLLAVGAWLLLGGGGEELDDLATPPAAAAAEPSVTPAPASPPPPQRLRDDAAGEDGRDPFAPLYVEPEIAAPAEGAVAPAAPAAPAVPAAPAAGAGTGSGATPAPTAGSTALSIALLRTEGAEPSRTAVFTVDGAEVVVAVGDSFGPDDSLLLLSLQEGPAAGGWTAVVQSGQGEPFSVVTGEVATVS